jgi:hypothetical protein
VHGQAVVADARVALLERLVDHAPLFPPASLTLSDALAKDRHARSSQASFMLGRLVWPASRFAELGDEPRALSIVLDGPFAADPRVEAVEARRPDPLAELAGVAPEVFVELPVGERLEAELAELGRLGLRAKVRCGGEQTPTVAELARFVRGCHAVGVPFKATAGLHHAVRRGAEHGFLNLLAAVVFGNEEEALAEDDPAAFGLDGEVFRWRGGEAGPDDLARARRERLRSVGSCSFREPVEELASLGVLPLPHDVT